VLHVTAGNLYGGVETFLVTLARYQKRVPELESEFALCFDGRLTTELHGTGAPVHSLGSVRLRNPLSVLRANVALARLLGETRYDAVVTHGEWPHALVGAVAKLSSSKLIAWAHGAPKQRHLLDRLATSIPPDLLIVNSHHTVAALGSAFAGVPSRVIHYPVEPRVPRDHARAEIRRELGTAESTLVIAFAARFERWKGHDLLLRAARALLDRNSGNWCVWLCGGVQRPSEQAYADELKRYVCDSGLSSRVHFVGPRSDIPDVFAAADLFCQPNTGPEPFGIVFVEALYAGLPVVATNMGGAAEIIDGSCGLLPEPNADSVASALNRVVTEATLRQRFSAGGPERARRLCDPEARIRDILEAIRGTKAIAR
jgi:glycosyltransferase involved in cell wall biosynthesis